MFFEVELMEFGLLRETDINQTYPLQAWEGACSLW